MARALINRPQVLFADEPTGALNRATGTAILDCLDEVNEEGQGIVMVTHDIKSACRGTRVVYMRDGQAVGEFRFAEPKSRGMSAARERELFSWLSSNGW